MPKWKQPERVLERVAGWLMQTANASHWFRTVDLLPFWNGLLHAFFQTTDLEDGPVVGRAKLECAGCSRTC